MFICIKQYTPSTLFYTLFWSLKYVYICICIYVYMYTHKHKQTHTHTHTHTLQDIHPPPYSPLYQWAQWASKRNIFCEAISKETPFCEVISNNIHPTIYSHVCLLRHIHVCDMTLSHVMRSNFEKNTLCEVILTKNTLCEVISNDIHPTLYSHVCVVWHIHMRDMTHSYVWHDLLICSSGAPQEDRLWCEVNSKKSTLLRSNLYTPNTLQHTASYCNILQHTATHCNTLQHTATLYNTPQHTVMLCTTLQHTATQKRTWTICKSIWWGLPTLQHTVTHSSKPHQIATQRNTMQHTATHCNTLLHTATHCNTLQHTATHCNTLLTLQHTATHFITLQHNPTRVLQCVAVCCSEEMTTEAHMYHSTPTRCNTLQHTATHRNTLQHTATHCNTPQHTATHRNTLQHTATHRNTPQHTATHRNTPQHTATHRNTKAYLNNLQGNLVVFTVCVCVSVCVCLHGGVEFLKSQPYSQVTSWI